MGMPSRAAGEIRGRQLAERIPGAVFLDVHSPDASRLHDNTVALFVRAYSQSLADSLKKAGCVVGYDIADMPVSDAVFRGQSHDPRRHLHDECQFYVVNNTTHANEIRAISPLVDVFTLPHHSVNLDGTKAPFNYVPRRVGYVGLPEQLSAVAEIEAVCARHGTEFVSRHPTSREACDALLRTLDVGVAFVEADGRITPEVVDLIKRYKPNTKATNFAAYGVPSVCSRYLSYEEFVDGGCMLVDTRSEMLYELDRLLGDLEHRGKMSRAAYAIGGAFHVDRIVEQYIAMAKTIRTLTTRPT